MPWGNAKVLTIHRQGYFSKLAKNMKRFVLHEIGVETLVLGEKSVEFKAFVICEQSCTGKIGRWWGLCLKWVFTSTLWDFLFLYKLFSVSPFLS